VRQESVRQRQTTEKDGAGRREGGCVPIGVGHVAMQVVTCCLGDRLCSGVCLCC
jgi:hypothetical protein